MLLFQLLSGHLSHELAEFNRKLAESAAKREEEPPGSPVAIEVLEAMPDEAELVKVELTTEVTKQVIEVTIDDSTPTPDSDDARVDLPKENRHLEIKMEMEDTETEVSTEYTAE